MNHNIKILELANNCELFDLIKFKDENFCIKTRFLNAVLNRWENYKEDEVSDLLNISKRSVHNLEKGKVNNIVTVLNYIHFFGRDYVKEKHSQHINYLRPTPTQLDQK